MQFTPEHAQEIEEVEILQANRSTGLAEVVASGVRMLIIPRETVPQEVGEVGRSSYRPRFGAILETPHAEVKRLRQIRRANGDILNIVLSLTALGEQQLECEAEGTP